MRNPDRLWNPVFLALALALLALLWAKAPEQLPVLHYKLVMAGLAGAAGYLLDRALFPYAHPASYLRGDWRREPGRNEDADHPVAEGYGLLMAASMLRQALLVMACMLTVGLGL